MNSRVSLMFRNITIQEWIVFSLMIVVGLACRFLLVDYSNVKPVAAFVLFGGFFFRHWSIPLTTLLAIMLFSDFVLKGYELPMKLSVYFALSIGVVLGMSIRARFSRKLEGLGWMPAFIAASLTMSTCFFLLTNGAVWLFADWYPRTLAGMGDCYMAGVPFWRNSMAGDLCFTFATVGCYWCVIRLIALSSEKASVETLEAN